MSENRPSRFNPYEDDPDRIAPDAHTRRTQRSESQAQDDPDQDWRQMVQPDWRERRREQTGQRPRTTIQLPVTSSSFIMWVSRGGWKILAAAAVGIFVLLIVVLLTGEAPENTAAGETTPTSQSQPSTPAPAAPITVEEEAPTPTPAAPAQQRFVVTGTGVEGLFLRDAPGGTILKTLPEGTQVEQIGPDQEAQGFVWKHIREPGGMEGWAASNWLQAPQ